MFNFKTLFAAMAALVFANAPQALAFKGKSMHILVFSKTSEFRHGSIPDGIKALEAMSRENNWTMVATEDSLQFNPRNLKKFDVIVLLSPTGNVWGDNEEAALMQFVKKGGGIAGIHAATDCEKSWTWYTNMIGGIFISHPKQQQMATLQVLDKTNPATRHLEDTWIRTDEWYNFKSLQPDNIPLLNIDEQSYTGGKNGPNHPMSWVKEFEGGRVFYTALGHTNQSYKDPLFLQHIKGGIDYAAGKK